MMAEILLQCENMSQGFGVQNIFQSINLTVYQGEILTVVGPSGCGKTTLLRTIGGLEALRTGSISLDGIDITQDTAEKRPVVLMFQQPLLFPHLTVLENIIFGLRGKKLDKKHRIKIGCDLLQKIELTECAARYPFELSGGQQQRVSLARALAVSPRLLLLDEPFSSLDPDLRVTIRSWVKRLLKSESITSIFVTHDKEEAMLMGDRVAVMMDGSLQQIGHPLDVYLRPNNAKVAQFFSEGLLLEDGSFVPASEICITKGDLSDSSKQIKGVITDKWIKSGQYTYRIWTKYGNITLTAQEEYELNDQLALSFNPSNRVYLR